MPDTILNQTEAPIFRNRSASIAALAAALAAAQKNFTSIPKDREVKVTTRTGGSYTFRYATMDAILSATMPALAEQSLAISQALSSWGDNYAVETTLYHSSGEWISNVTPMFVNGRQGNDGKTYPPGNQELGSAQTYARRYGVSALLCITADEDDDGNSADGHHAEQVPFKPGAPGTAGGGAQFRPERRARSSWGEGGKQGAIDEAKRDGLVNDVQPKAGPLGGREATVEEARKAKITAAVNKRVDLLKRGAPWMRDALNQFWTDNEEWIDWMTDPNNKAMVEYDRFSKAYADAELTIRPVELA